MSSKMYEIQHGNAPRCSHILETNLQCQAPALRGHNFCYWHEQNRKHKQKFVVPLLETEKAIQATLSQVLRELHEDKIDTKRANSMFYGLSLAMYNVRRISNSGSSDHIIDLPPAMQDVLEAPPDLRETTALPLVILSEAKDPAPAATTTTAEPLSNHNFPHEAWRGGASLDSIHEAWRSGASAPRSETVEEGASAPVEPAPPKFPPASARMTLPPEHFASPAPLNPSGPFLLREQRFTADDIRAYWTQHLPAEVRNLRSTDGEFFYEPLAWLPLTQEEIAFLRDNKAENRGAGTPEQNFWYERLIKHHSCHNILPPKPEEILAHYEGPESGKSLAEILTNTLRKRAAKLASGS